MFTDGNDSSSGLYNPPIWSSRSHYSEIIFPSKISKTLDLILAILRHPDDRHWDNQNTLPGRCLLDDNRHSGNQNLLSVDDIALDICL